MTIVRTIKTGSTPDDRVILQTTTSSTPDPTVGDLGAHLKGADFLHLYAELGGSLTSATVTPWYRSKIAEQWFEGSSISFSPTNTFAVVEVRGEEALFLVTDALTGSGTLKLWAGISFTGPN